MSELNFEARGLVSSIIKKFLQNSRGSGSWNQVPVLDDKDILLGERGFTFVLQVKNVKVSSSILSAPEWLDVEMSDDVTISFPNGRETELEYLLRKSIERFFEVEDDSPKSVLIQTLQSIASLWKFRNQPLSEKAQRGLVGEISGLQHLLAHGAPGAITKSWDETSQNRIDIAVQGCIDIEVKSRAFGSSNVEISSQNQLIQTQDVPLYLCVVEVKSSTAGLTLPLLIESLLNEMNPNINHEQVSSLRNRIDAFYDVFSLREYFSTKWELGSKMVYLVPENHGSNLLEEALPSGISVSGYSLDLNSLPDPAGIEWGNFSIDW